jgi:hypothetical protein
MATASCAAICRGKATRPLALISGSEIRGRALSGIENFRRSLDAAGLRVLEDRVTAIRKQATVPSRAT